jgi:hypothetical protein
VTSAVTMATYNDDGTVTVKTRNCMVCQKPGELTVKTVEFDAWADGNGPFIQDAMPSLSAGERELLMTGTHDECWAQMFAEEEPEDDDVEYYAQKDQERFEEGEAHYPSDNYQGMVDELDYPWNQPEEK